MTPEDLWVIQQFSALGEKHSGYPAVSIHEDFRYRPDDVISGTQDWLYEHLGALFGWSSSGRPTRKPASKATSGSTGSATTPSGRL